MFKDMCSTKDCLSSAVSQLYSATEIEQHMMNDTSYLFVYGPKINTVLILSQV